MRGAKSVTLNVWVSTIEKLKKVPFSSAILAYYLKVGKIPENIEYRKEEKKLFSVHLTEEEHILLKKLSKKLDLSQSRTLNHCLDEIVVRLENLSKKL